VPLSWNEIKTRSLAFAKEWEHESSEDAEAKSFWDDFFNVFGISHKRIASFEEPVKNSATNKNKPSKPLRKRCSMRVHNSLMHHWQIYKTHLPCRQFY
jgi:hypothetical protein